MISNLNRWGTTVLALFAMLTLAPANPAYAQALYGSIVGTVTDASGAAIPGATVKVTHTETNQSRDARTNEAGGFSITTLPTGAYDVTVSHDGFQTYASRGLMVGVSGVVRVNAALEIGAITESVRVNAQAVTLQTDSAEVRSQIQTKSLEELPVPGNRNYQNLLIMVPGFSPPANQHSVSASPSRALTFSANGTSRNSNNIRIEGATATVGPPLMQIGLRSYLAGRIDNTPENMIKWIRQPHSVDPQTAMPETGVTEADGRDIAAYLYTLR